MLQAILRVFLLIATALPALLVCGQQDSRVQVDRKIITLKEVVIRNNLNVPAFIDRIKNDTSFYKAFKNLRVLGYTSLNDVRMYSKKGKETATLQSKVEQQVKDGCRSMQTLTETTSGDIKDEAGNWNYYTMQLYASLFFTTGQVCGEDNIVKGDAISTKNKSGLNKHKEQLKYLFFNPGKKVPGIPFMGDKMAIFDEDVAKLYDFIIDMTDLDGQPCYLFTIKPRADLTGSERNGLVIDEMVTWFNANTMEIAARNYSLSYDAGVYDFNVRMEVELTKVGTLLVPRLLRYNGSWHVSFKKREKGIFTATLFNFVQ